MPNTYTQATEIPTIDVTRVTVQKNGSTEEIVLKTASKIAIKTATDEQKAVPLVIKGVLIAQKKAVTTVTGNTITLTDNVFTPELVKILQGGTITYAQVLLGGTTDVLAATAKDNGVTIALVKPSSDGTLSVQVTEKEITVNLAVSTGSITSKLSDVVTAIQENTQATALVDVAVIGTATTIASAVAETNLSGEIASYTPPATGTENSVLDTFTLKCYSSVYDSSGNITKYECISYPNCTGQPVALNSEDDKFRAPEYTIDSAPSKGQAPYTITYVQPADLPPAA